MFQIKTDIRQYNCETREKVEKLIRNWVIRPSDLIYNDDAGEWNPIGQHPSFDDLFRELDEEESRMPDTVVTADRPRGEKEEGGEVTQITESPLEEDDADDAPKPPEPSEDVEGVIRDSDEITMMTDKTLDMMRLDDEGGDEAVEEDEDTDVVEKDEVVEEDEDTDVVEKDEVVEEDEDTDVVEKDGVVEEDEHTDVVEKDEVSGDDESTNVVEKNEVDGAPDDAPESDDTSEDDEETTNVLDRDELDSDTSDEGEEAEQSNGGGRHGLPEDVFVTNEIPSQSAQESVLDELGELEEEDDDFDLDEGLAESSEEPSESEEEVERDDGERRARWRIVMSDDQKSVDDEWEDVADELRDTDELNENEVQAKVAEDLDQPQDPIDFDDEDLGETAELKSVERETSEAEEDLEEVEVEAVADDEDLDGLLDDAAELVGVRRKDTADDEAARETVGSEAAPAFVSEGYSMDLPIDVGPSDEDIARGVPTATVGEDIKESTFPYPKPKHPGEVIVRKFGLGEELPDEDTLADDLPDAGDPDVDSLAETKPLGSEKASSPSRRSSSRSQQSSGEQPKDQSVLIVIFVLGMFIIALVLGVYFLG
jgi:hypothetical protein